MSIRKCKDGEHEPFINPLTDGKPVKHIDEDGLLGEKGKAYYECYICNCFYDPKTKKTAIFKKNGKVTKGKTEGAWWM